MKKLIIVESPAKAGTIKKFLGKNVEVVASKGHLRDLPKSRLGVDIDNNFNPEYINVRGKGDLIKELKKKAKNSDVIYLATDPDREGEAIAWHLATLLDLNLSENNRVTFNEITKEAVKKAVDEPRKINMDLVDAQQARRVLDRIVGYKTSPILWKKVKSGLSAGRVQSVALRIIIEREEEIRNFVPEEYWNINVLLTDNKIEFLSQFYGKNGKKQKLKSKEEVDEIVNSIKNNKFIVKEVKIGQRKKNPTPPFTTSTLQQAASRSINFNIKKTMSVAQKLYEGIKIPKKGTTGLITYMRTDSTRISEEARKKAEVIISSSYGEEYFENRYFKTKASAQDGHEAIRPSYPELKPEDIKEYLSNDEYKLYKLIYQRFLASLMKPAIYDTITLKINNNDYEFRTSGSKLNFLGFLKVYGIKEFNKSEKLEREESNKEENDIEENEFEKFPEVKIDQEVFYIKENAKQSFTEPPVRYTEASIVKKLEENGIGRPSTYVPTINTIEARRYIKKEKKTLVPTELGEIVNKLLVKNFDDVFNVKFTFGIEEKFDYVAEGKENWINILNIFYSAFKKDLDKCEEIEEKIEIKDEVSEEICEICGKHMVYKMGRFGKFLACMGYPECKNTKKIEKYIKEVCPKCSGRIIVRKTKHRKNYYICENNPKNNCDYISWEKPEKTNELGTNDNK